MDALPEFRVLNPSTLDEVMAELQRRTGESGLSEKARRKPV